MTTGRRAASQSTTTAYRPLKVPQAVSVKMLAELMGINPIELIKQLMRAGIMANINQVIDFDTAAALAAAYGFRATSAAEVRKEAISVAPEEEPALLEARPPVVTVLGHVDHGKTTLLDAIRATSVAEREVGGITQHIGAYQATYKDQKITFLDTPGHEAFTAMRARGAQVTDIAVLVVAADDGVMPQTVEAIDHVRAANVPIIVAINKTDRPDADLDRVKRQLSEHKLLVEEWGGEVIAVPVSAKEQQGIEDLLENILVVAEVSELKANPNRAASGVVVEAKLDKTKGPLATVLVKSGTLKVGDHLVVGTTRGKIKALLNDLRERVTLAGPSIPVEVLGLSQSPQAGDPLIVVEDERAARQLVEKRLQEEQAAGPKLTLEEMFSQIRAGDVKDLNLIIKADVQGSVEAIRDALSQLSSEIARVRVVHAASGTITESDVFLAVASKAIILGFNSQLDVSARQAAEQGGIEVRFYNVIYTLLEDIKNTLEGLVEPVAVEIVEGHATVRATFPQGRRGMVAGIFVNDGRMVRNARARVLRGGQLLHDGPIASLKHFKENVREMAVGTECGIGLDGFTDFQEGDVIEVYGRDRPGQ